MSVLACGSERGAGAHEFRKVAVDDAVVLGFDDVVEKVVSLKNARLMGDAVVALKQEGERVLQGLGERRADRGGVAPLQRANGLDQKAAMTHGDDFGCLALYAVDHAIVADHDLPDVDTV